MPDLALVGAFQTKAQAAQALGDLLCTSGRCLLTASTISGKRGATSRCPFWSAAERRPDRAGPSGGSRRA